MIIILENEIILNVAFAGSLQSLLQLIYLWSEVSNNKVLCVCELSKQILQHFLRKKCVT